MDVSPENGVLDLGKLWTPTDKNKLLRASSAPYRARFGGTGSSKSSDSLMEVVVEYMFRWDGINVLFLRRRLTELHESSIRDFKNFVPEYLYDWNGKELSATLKQNKSRIRFGGLTNNSEDDLAKFLSTAYPVMVLDECGQFSGSAVQFLQTRNRVNPECNVISADGVKLEPVMFFNSNPMGPYWKYYKTLFVDKKPMDPPENVRRDRNGRYWEPTADGGWKLYYNPDDYFYVHSTVRDNVHMMERDPGLVTRLSKLPADQRAKYLDGDLQSVEGSYFSCWDESRNVIALADDADRVIWQPWQPRWMGWDGGRAHWTAAYWFTLALVRSRMTGEYDQRCVCYREYVSKGKDYLEQCRDIAKMTRLGLPGEPDATELRSIFYSHEKFAKSRDAGLQQANSQAGLISRELTRLGLPALTPNDARPGSRAEKAQLVYSYLDQAKVYVLSGCTKIIEALPTLVTDPDNLEDVLKLDTEEDDCYDGFAMGLYNWFGRAKPKPFEVKLAEAVAQQETPTQKFMVAEKMRADRKGRARWSPQYLD